jgi:hypothetical protein
MHQTFFIPFFIITKVQCTFFVLIFFTFQKHTTNILMFSLVHFCLPFNCRYGFFILVFFLHIHYFIMLFSINAKFFCYNFFLCIVVVLEV